MRNMISLGTLFNINSCYLIYKKKTFVVQWSNQSVAIIYRYYYNRELPILSIIYYMCQATCLSYL